MSEPGSRQPAALRRDPEGTQWERVAELVDDDPTVRAAAVDPLLLDLGPTPRAFEPGGFDELPPELVPPVSPAAEPTTIVAADAEATVIAPPAPARPRSRRMVLWKPPPRARYAAAKASLAGLAVGLAVLVPVTAAVVLLSWVP